VRRGGGALPRASQAPVRAGDDGGESLGLSMADAAQQLPPPTFDILVQVIAAPCMVHLGLVANPATGQVEKNLEQARWAIDLLHVLEEKTRGALSDAERARLSQMLSQLRSAYTVQLTR